MKKIEILLGIIIGLLVALVVLDISIIKNLNRMSTPYVTSAGTSKKPLPKLIKSYEPEYPESARMAGLEGKVIIKVEVDETGKVRKAMVLRSSGHKILDSAALEAASKFEFEPAIQNGKPVSSSVVIPFQFSLK